MSTLKAMNKLSNSVIREKVVYCVFFYFDMALCLSIARTFFHPDLASNVEGRILMG